MTTSLLGFAGLAVLALAFVVYPMVRKHKSVAAELNAEDLHRQTHREWYQQRVAEIEQEARIPMRALRCNKNSLLRYWLKRMPTLTSAMPMTGNSRRLLNFGIGI
ncbi:MAG: hypothetical protein CM15mP120_25620 [Pseudomonadota bacterium]|nr:MAG: hypothetical protein CM15mP120_25620 [Pseudomonadota bacterium]